MRPLRLHLDTSDYSRMYRAEPGTSLAHVRDTLKGLVKTHKIEIGLSYHVVFELLQKATPEYRSDRLERARLLSDLCERNALPYPSDLGQGFRFSNDGLWMPRIDLDEIEIEGVIQHLMRTAANHPEMSRYERRVHASRKYLKAWARDYPADAGRLHAELWPFLFARNFATDGDLVRYLSDEMSREAANEKLRLGITDPASVYVTYFDLYDRDNPIVERRDEMAVKIEQMLNQLRLILGESKELGSKIDKALEGNGEAGLSDEGRAAFMRLKADNKTFRREILSPEDLFQQGSGWRTILGDEGAMIAAQIFLAIHREGRPIKRSDAIDLIHASYLPHVDLWRGDKPFSDLLIKHKVNLSERVVPTLEGLLIRIEAEMALLAQVP